MITGSLVSPEAVEAEASGRWRRDFRWRWAAQAASETGSAVGYSALPIVAVLVVNATDFQVSLLSVLSSVVSAVLALPLGPWIEYHRKRPIMIGADVFRFVAVGSIPVSAYFGWLTYGQLCAVAIAQMAALLAFNAASTADLRTLVPVAHRAEANSRFETTLWTAYTLGPPVGGALISAVGAAASMAVDAVSFLASAFGISRVRTPEPPPPQRSKDQHWSRDLVAGWRYILRHRGLSALFWNSLVFGGCIMGSSPLITVFMLRDLGFEPWQYGVSFGLSAIAGIAGSLLVKPILSRFPQHRVLLVVGVGRNLWLGLIPFAVAGTTGFVLITLSEFLLLLFVGVFNPTFATYRMNATDDQHMARVSVAWSISTKIAQPVFIAAAGTLAAVTSARTAIIVCAVLLIASSVLLPWRGDQPGVGR
ncbi:MAG: MFS transporter [Hamadaea sp.]|uniref:MFS transporter n=1 Tax=Hamadaea sp. TaxID=2024425 RepID=UPI00183A8674|nr:MFS transporter [Hamadaea sp.]NUR72560.1 MFS transporter [Hamadaea sp.]NUT20573.1 MFS transporter [Hamadaea sp.]